MSKINNPELKAAWLKALRSGDYKQAQGRLMDIHTMANGEEVRSFCCLGVLCDVAIKEGVLKASWGADIRGGDRAYDAISIYEDGSDTGDYEVLPYNFAASIGIQKNPLLKIGGKLHETAVLNDDGVKCHCGEDVEECEMCVDGAIAYDFKMIADLIEEQL